MATTLAGPAGPAGPAGLAGPAGPAGPAGASAPDRPTAGSRGSARERLLAAAEELFYGEGINTVGIDRIIERAGVAKASLYSTFGSKEALIAAYLAGRRERQQQRLERGIERFATPREKLIGIFEVQGETFGRPAYRGCAFMNASAETQPGSVVEQASDSFRGWLRDLVVGLAREAGATDADALAAQLLLLYDGATVSARMDRNPAAGATARTAATVLVDAALGGA